MSGLSRARAFVTHPQPAGECGHGHGGADHEEHGVLAVDIDLGADERADRQEERAEEETPQGQEPRAVTRRQELLLLL